MAVKRSEEWEEVWIMEARVVGGDGGRKCELEEVKGLGRNVGKVEGDRK